MAGDDLRLMSSEEIGEEMEKMLAADTAARAELQAEPPSGKAAPVTPPWHGRRAGVQQQEAWQQEDDARVAEALHYYQQDQREDREEGDDYQAWEGWEEQAWEEQQGHGQSASSTAPPPQRPKPSVGSKRKNADGSSRPRGGRKNDPNYRKVMSARYMGQGSAGDENRQQKKGR